MEKKVVVVVVVIFFKRDQLTRGKGKDRERDRRELAAGLGKQQADGGFIIFPIQPIELQSDYQTDSVLLYIDGQTDRQIVYLYIV